MEVDAIGLTLFLTGAAAVAAALTSNSVVRTVSMQRNHIADDGAEAIAEAVEQNSGLTILSLGVNKIGVRGATALAQALKINKVLRKLDLGCKASLHSAHRI